jgi:hypothetical protein
LHYASIVQRWPGDQASVVDINIVIQSFYNRLTGVEESSSGSGISSTPTSSAAEEEGYDDEIEVEDGGVSESTSSPTR